MGGWRPRVFFFLLRVFFWRFVRISLFFSFAEKGGFLIF